MIIYKDVLSGDEMFSDAFDPKEVDNVVYEVDAAMITVGSGADVDIGANPSAEEADEGVNDAAEQVNNVVYNFGLQQTAFDKKSYMSYIKGYMKAVKAHLEKEDPEKVAEFEQGATAQVKKILGNFKNYDFYTGESMDIEGMIALMDYREDGVTPYFIFWKHGLKQEKV